MHVQDFNISGHVSKTCPFYQLTGFQNKYHIVQKVEEYTILLHFTVLAVKYDTFTIYKQHLCHNYRPGSKSMLNVLFFTNIFVIFTAIKVKNGTTFGISECNKDASQSSQIKS
jgi:hypothetical protein